MTKKMIEKITETAALNPAAYETGTIAGERVGAEMELRRAHWWGKIRFLFFEADGDFNPGWFVFCAFCVLILVINAAAILVVPKGPNTWKLLSSLFVGDFLSMWLATTLTTNLARAKVAVGAATKGASSIASVGADTGVGNIFIDREHE